MNIILPQKHESTPHQLKMIAAKQNIPVTTVARMMRLNVFTPNQMVALTGLTLGQIMNYCRDGKKSGKLVPSRLTRVGIMPEWEKNAIGEMEEVVGRLYILRDEKAEQLLVECNQ